MDVKWPERFLRSKGIMSEDDLRSIQSTKVAIGGLGLGGSIFINLVRLGFEKFHISDPDIYERTNINRQRLAKESTLGVRKDTALIKEALDINPNVQIRSFPEGINQQNVSDFLQGVDWVIDVVDVFALNEKLALNNEAAKRKIPVASCGSLGFSSVVVVFDENTPSFAELTGLDPAADYPSNIRRFVQFLCPQVPDYMETQMQKAMDKQSHIPFVVPGVEFAAATAATEVCKQILKIGKIVRAPQGIFLDPVNLKIEIFEANFKARQIFPNRKAA